MRAPDNGTCSRTMIRLTQIYTIYSLTIECGLRPAVGVRSQVRFGWNKYSKSSCKIRKSAAAFSDRAASFRMYAFDRVCAVIRYRSPTWAYRFPYLANYHLLHYQKLFVLDQQIFACIQSLERVCESHTIKYYCVFFSGQYRKKSSGLTNLSSDTQRNFPIKLAVIRFFMNPSV